MSAAEAGHAAEAGIIRWAFNAVQWEPTEVEWGIAAGCIQPEEKERIGRFHFKEDAKLSMAGRLMIRKVVAEVQGIPYDSIKLGRTKGKKPFLASPPLNQQLYPQFSFNISHSGDYVVLAASPDHTIGVDLSDIRPLRGNTTVDDYFDLMTPQFTSHEWRQIRENSTAQSEMEQLHLFHRFWSLKESYIKAIGVGLQLDLKRLNFTTDDTLQLSTTGTPVTGATLEVDGLLTTEWAFHQSYLDDEHVISVASSPPKQQAHASNEEESDRDGGVRGGSVGGSVGGSGESPPQSTEPATAWRVLQFSDLVSAAVPLHSTVDDAYWAAFSQRKVKGARR